MLEVIIAFAITSILVGATMPNYQDYTARTRVTEGLKQAMPAQSAGTAVSSEASLHTSRLGAGNAP